MSDTYCMECIENGQNGPFSEVDSMIFCERFLNKPQLWEHLKVKESCISKHFKHCLALYV